MIASDAASAAATWRPQLFGDKRAGAIPDPIIEPLWTGPRVLAYVDGQTVRLTDAQGQPIEDQAEIVESLRESVAGATVLLDGFLTPEPIQPTEATSMPRRNPRIVLLMSPRRSGSSGSFGCSTTVTAGMSRTSSMRAFS